MFLCMYGNIIPKQILILCPILTKLSETAILMSTVISPSLVKIGLKTKNFYHYAIFCRDPFLNCNYSSEYIINDFPKDRKRKSILHYTLKIFGFESAGQKMSNPTPVFKFQNSK